MLVQQELEMILKEMDGTELNEDKGNSQFFFTFLLSSENHRCVYKPSQTRRWSSLKPTVMLGDKNNNNNKTRQN